MSESLSFIREPFAKPVRGLWRSSVFLIALMTVSAARADDEGISVFGGIGQGDRAVHIATLGATRSFRGSQARANDPWDVYGELAIGRWFVQNDRSSMQYGLTPFLRYTDRHGLFVEVGIGLNAITPIFRSRDHQFSTTFNFGDQLGFGWRFGTSRENEIALRLQHFSNAGIKKPNPGQDFGVLRYARRF